MTFFRRLNLSSRLLLGLVAVAASVGVGVEMLRPGHHVHLGNGGHHHHWHMGPHSHGDEGAVDTASNTSCTLGDAHRHHVPGTHGEGHPHDEPDHGRPFPKESDEGAFIDAFPLEEAAAHIVLGAALSERGTSFRPALKTRTTAPPFLPITPRGPPHSSLV